MGCTKANTAESSFPLRMYLESASLHILTLEDVRQMTNTMLKGFLWFSFQSVT